MGQIVYPKRGNINEMLSELTKLCDEQNWSIKQPKEQNLEKPFWIIEPNDQASEASLTTFRLKDEEGEFWTFQKPRR